MAGPPSYQIPGVIWRDLLLVGHLWWSELAKRDHRFLQVLDWDRVGVV